MGLAGLGQQLVSSVVGIRYEANVDQAKSAIKGLAGEQKKAAKETAEAYKQQSEAFNKHVTDFGKGAAIITGAVLVARSGLKAYGEDVRLTAGSSKVNIDALSESWDGLKTRVELMTLAQAGNRGAWKLTTGQLQIVTDGMRALEAQGFESQKVFDKFTEVLKKGKLEGLDEFGLSVKATGNQAEDLKVLMNALGKEVSVVGGNFASTGDDAARALVKMDDYIKQVQVSVGFLTTKFLGLGSAIGTSLAKWWSGRDLGQEYFDADEDRVRNERARNQYALKLQLRREGFGVLGNRVGRSTFDTATGADEWFGTERSLAGPSDEDKKLAARLSKFSEEVRRSMDGKGPLASASPAEFAKMITGMPEDWRLVDEELGKNVDRLMGNLSARMASGMVLGLINAKPTGGPDDKPKGKGRGGGSRASSPIAASIDDTISAALAQYESDEAAQAAGARSSQAILDASANARFMEAMASGRESIVGVGDAFAGVTKANELNAAERESFLERNFGKIEEFEAYGRAFDTLAAVGGAAWDTLYTAIVTGEELSGAAIKKAIGVALGAEARKLGAEGFMTMLRGAAYTVMDPTSPRGPLTIGAGAAMVAGSLIVGRIATEIGGGSAGGSPGGGAARSAAGVGGRPTAQDHRPVSTSVVLGDSMSDDSARERARRTRRAMNAAHRYGPAPAGVRYG